MKLHFSAFATALAIVPSNAWTNVGLGSIRPSSTMTTRSTFPSSSSSPSPLSTIALKSVAEALEIPAPKEVSTESGKIIADGSVVSSFPGGLLAVRLRDDNDDNSSTLGGDLLGHKVILPGDRNGLVIAHRPPVVFVFCDMAETEEVATYDEGAVYVLDSLSTVALSNYGGQSTVDCFGRGLGPVQEAKASTATGKRAIFAPIPQVKDIALINKPMLTGITMFDALAPIGKGQNMLLIGHNLDDMRKYVCDVLSTQTKSGAKTKCVYAACQDRTKIESMLREAGLSNDVTLVAASRADDGSVDMQSKAAEATAIASSACAIAETFVLDQGMDTLVIVDTLDQHKLLWDTTTRVLVDVFGVEAVVQADREGAGSSELRAFLSSLVQRSAQYKQKQGGGSLTLLLLNTIPSLTAAESEDTVFSTSDFENCSDKVQDRINMLVKRNIPLTAANLRKIDIPIPSDAEGARRLALQHVDDLISMSDGQIWMDERLEAAGRCPPMDAQRSVTRIGIGADTESRADAPAMRRVVEGLRLDFAQAASMDGADVATNASMRQMRKSKALLLAMHQPAGSKGRSLSESCVVMMAAAKGYLDGVIEKGVEAGSEEGEQVMKRLLDHVKVAASSVMEEIDTTQDMSEQALKQLEEEIKLFLS